MIKHLIFDMGGVLLRLHWHEQVSVLLGYPVPADNIHDIWSKAPSTRAFDTGKMDFITFYEAFKQDFKIELSFEAFEKNFNAMLGEDFAGSVELLTALRPHYTLSLLSNTNSYHWPIMLARQSFLPLLHHHFTSMELGYMKPDLKIFQQVLNALQTQPEHCLFFDDGLSNVLVARELGMHAEQVFNPQDIYKVLEHYSLQY